MNNDEPKKKIVEVLFPVIKSGNISCNEENACKKCWFPCEIERTAYRLSDALIAAGIGDVKELKQELKVQEAVANQYRIFFEEQKYWKEVAERALENEIKNRINITGDVEDLVYTYYGRAIYQAEKELAEERKE